MGGSGSLLLIVLVIAVAMVPAMAAPGVGGCVNSTSCKYELVCKSSASGTIPVLKYRSLRTGLNVIIAQVEGPLVNGYFTFATEAQDDDGLPHTLEHLIFLGSEEYPFKGVLDLLANRCLASGTNAWTDIDHTAYTVQTAGSDGFLNFIPIYLDHLLYPTLNESGFITEVHYINGDGEDAGVVYSEMQARENSDEDRCFLAMMRALYPYPSGYRYETGGILKNLRESTNNINVQKYHKKFYRPENLNIIITGQVKEEDVFNALDAFEEKILSKGNRGSYERPWQSEVPKFNQSEDIEVLYPSDLEDNGMVLVAWRGPSAVTELQKLMSVSILTEYLTHTSISPLPKIFVEVDDPLASRVKDNFYENSESTIYFKFIGVPKKKIDEVKPLLMKTLNELAVGDTKLDMSILRDILNLLILKQDSKLETSPHDSIAGLIIADVLYGHHCSDMTERLNKKSWYKYLLTQNEKYWLDLLKEYFIDKPSVTVRGVPSRAEATRLEEEEKLRIEQRKKKLGEAKLKELAEKFENAKALNEIAPSKEMLESVPVPGVDSINFHSLDVYNNYHRMGAFPQAHPHNFPLDKLPVKFQLDHIHSNFVELVAIMDTFAVTPEMRPYLPLLLEVMLESPIVKGNVTIPYETVVRELAKDTISSGAGLGLDLFTSTFTCGPYCTYAVVVLKVEMAKYKQGVTWLEDLLFNTKLTEERVRLMTNRLLNSIAGAKRRGPVLLHLMHNDVNFQKNTNQNKGNILRQQKFLNCLLNRLEKEPEVVLQELEQVRCAITHLDRITVHMATDVTKLAEQEDPAAPWLQFAKDVMPSHGRSLTIVADSQLRSHELFGNVTGFLTGVASVDSAYLIQSTDCVNSHAHPDIPAILTAIQYLIQLEGPMWKEIRGNGLSYSYDLVLNPGQGTLVLKLAKSAQLTGAYAGALSILQNHINGSTPWEYNLFESARSSLIYSVIEREAVVSDVVQQSLLAYYKDVSHSYNKQLLKRIAEVTVEDIKRVAFKYFTPLIDPQTSRTVIVCHPSKINETVQEFRRYGHNLEIIESIEKSRFSQ